MHLEARLRITDWYRRHPEVESEVGRGTRIGIVLPVFDVADAPAKDEVPVAAPSIVLLVEPHPVLRPMLCEALRAAGHTVVECDSATNAMQAARWAIRRGSAGLARNVMANRSLTLALRASGPSSANPLSGKLRKPNSVGWASNE